MKTILCYGDSNTWGWDPISEPRFDKLERASELDLDAEALARLDALFDTNKESS